MAKPSLQPPTPAPAPPTTPSRAPLTNFLTRPSKWFGRSASAPRVAGLGAGNDDSPRASTSSLAPGSSAARKPKISRPTDPRPILDAEGYMGVPGSRSVLDLSRPSLTLPPSASSPAHAKSSLDLRYVPPPSPSRSQHNVYIGSPNPGYGTHNNSNNPYGGGGGGAGTGDLRNISRRAWARSADDLRMVGIPLPPAPSPMPMPPPSPTSPNAPLNSNAISPPHSPRTTNDPGLRVNTSLRFVDKVAAYRARSDSTPLSGTAGGGPAAGGYVDIGNDGTMGSFTGAPLTQAPLQMSPPLPNYPPASSSSSQAFAAQAQTQNSLPIQMQPPPFYARRRTDSERSGRSGKSGRSAGDASPGSTPPSARGTGMVWPPIGGAGAVSPGRDGGNAQSVNTTMREQRERNGSGGGSPVSISISAPMLAGGGGVDGFGAAGGGLGQGTGTGGGMGTGHVHTRSHSFTPKLPSRLAQLGGASPGRKGSAGELEALPAVGDREQGKQRGGAFAFFTGGSNTQKQPPPSTAGETLLAPPHIILEPPSGGDAPRSSLDANAALRPASSALLLQHQDSSSSAADNKRASQIVYATGFVNRLVTPALADPRSWKAFRAEVRGTKIVLHKVPGDRAGAVRELFVSGVVAEEDDKENGKEREEGEDVFGAADDVGGGGQRREVQGSMGRKKRAYWGRGRHPGLGVVGGGLGGVFGAADGRERRRIEKGTVEALVHEMTFATVFLGGGDASAEDAAGDEEDWREFALTVLFCLPLVAGRTRFEVEFVRCAGYLVSGASAEEADKHRERVAFMAREYLRFHGAPADEPGWEAFRAETIPEVFFPKTQGTAGGLPASVSTQAMYTPTPLGSPALAGAPFSPRPDTSARMVGLLDALGVHEPIVSSGPPALASPRSPQPSRSARKPWAVALEKEGLSRDVLLAIDPHLLARSLTLFHRAVLEQAPENPTASFIEGARSPLFGSDSAPHFLTKVILVQVLMAETGAPHGGATPGGEHQTPNQGPSSRTHSRSEVISVWARVGELCRVAGDECTWRAIVAALCSAPVARLEKVWRRVEPPALAAVEGWSRLEGEGCEIGEPRVTVWGGDIPRSLKEEVDAARESDGEALVVAPMERALDIFEGFRKPFLLCPRRASLAEDEVGDDLQRLVSFWRDKCAEGGGSGGIAAKFVRVDHFISLSLAAEPRRKGLFEPHYWTRAANATPFASLIPLLFPPVFPTSALIDPGQLLRGRVDSGSDPRVLHLDPQRLDPLRLPQKVVPGITELGQAPTVIPIFDGEVLLSVWHGSDGESSVGSRPSSRLPSRPPSSVVPESVEVGLGRAPSVRVKPGSSQGLDRKTSVARRSSLPSPAQRRTFVASEPSSEPPLRVRVLAGTLNRLVSILVHGIQSISVSVADDNGEMSLREGKTRELMVDHAEFSKLWWCVYRSLVSPLVFFELLRKMYLQIRPRGAVPSVAELLYIAGSRTEVLERIADWLTHGGGAQDVLDDLQLHGAVLGFLNNSIDHSIPKSPNANDPAVEQALATLTDVRGRLRRTFETNTMRPSAPFPTFARPTLAANGQRSRAGPQSREPPDIDKTDPEELVDNLDAMAAAAFGNITNEDLFILSDLLEVQTADRTGWYLSFYPSEEPVEIQNMYSYLQEVEPSALISELGNDSLYRMLPPSIRSCIRAYVILRKWTVAQLVAPRLGLHARQSRMELILRAIEVTRLRSVPKAADSPEAIVDFPCTRSFAEAVLTSAVLSVESRLHSRPWLNIAAARGAQCDSIASLVANPATRSLSSTRELTLDVGWFLERMLEILAAPDIRESAIQQEGVSLINFEKRRNLCNLIFSARKGSPREETTRRAFERLNNIEKDVWLLQFDHRGIREEAYRESASGPNSSPVAARRAVRPFQKTIALQIEKNRRDRTLRSRLHKERVQEQTKNEKREDQLNRAMRKQPSTPQQQKHQRGKKSMSSAFLHFMRPISSAFGNEMIPSPTSKRTVEELEFLPTGKPALVISLVEARVAQFINNDRSFTFQLDTEDGGHYLLQAINKRELAKWVDTINRVTQTAAKRRLTYLGTPKPQLADHLHDPVAASRDPLAVFGVDLNFLLRREAGSDEVPAGAIPSVVERCLSEIEARGLTEVGIYRLAGAASTITALKEAFNRGEDPIDAATDIHAVCDLVKSWFRVLPEPLFPAKDYYAAIEATLLENLDDRLAATRSVVQGLPGPNFDLLRRVTEHLDRVSDFEDKNQMTAEGLAIVFSPNLLRAPQENFATILANMAHTHKLVKTLITHFHVIFDDGDLEADGDAEDGNEVAAYDEDGDDSAAVVDLEATEEAFRAPRSPTLLEDVAENDEDDADDEEENAEDLPHSITAELDQSPLDFSTLTYKLSP
ncbi:Rho GTPase activating protein 22 [Favolaschia claudopus]|uniref:Rho GTPase activating protein 22 n=1 Tax=Favolaschia claudopus TaxID=2862362 RepID=A0AAW0ALC5_9AGAR